LLSCKGSTKLSISPLPPNPIAGQLQLLSTS
jgi:hypothetical protein